MQKNIRKDLTSRGAVWLNKDVKVYENIGNIGPLF